jgi:hypothetical protein
VSHVLSVDTVDFNDLITNLEDRAIIKEQKRSVQQAEPTENTRRHTSSITNILKYEAVSNLTGTQVVHLQYFAILTLTDNNLSNLHSSSLSLPAGDW